MIDWVWNYGIPIFLAGGVFVALLALALVLLSDTIKPSAATTNPIQYLRNYLNARRMKREREERERHHDGCMSPNEQKGLCGRV